MRDAGRMWGVACSAVVALSLLLSPVVHAEGLPASVDPEEWKQFQETLDRYRERMTAFQTEARAIVDVAEAEERKKIKESYGAQSTRLEENENALRRVAISRLEAFLQKYPDTSYTADMMFRLADLYFEEAELAWFAADEEYLRIEARAVENSDMELPAPPLKDYARPMELYRQVIERHQDYANLADTYYMLAWCYSATNSVQYDELSARDTNLIIVQRYPGTVFSNDANMRLGEHFFDLPGTAEDPVVNVPVAISYYETVLADGPEGRNFDEAIYKLGWAHYKLNNYDRALAYLVQLLDYSDSQFLQTGKISNMRPEAVEYLAISYADIGLRAARRPVDIASAHFEKVGDRKWQHDVVERLAEILETQTRYEDAIDALAFLQTRWPLDPENPQYQAKIASHYVRMYPPQVEKSARAMAELSERYGEGSAWYVANRANPEAIAKARSYIETSLASVAVEYLEQARNPENAARKFELYQLAATKFEEFLTTFPFGADYDLYEWYYALSLFESNQFATAEKAYTQILKNDRSPFRDGARFQVMKCREQLLLAKFGKIDAVPATATVERVVTTPYNKQVTVYAVSDEHKSFIAAADDLVAREFSDPEWAKALEADRGALVYLPAQVYYLHGHYEEARARFDKLFAAFPNTDEAVYASSYYVNTYTYEGNLEAVRTYITKFRTMNLGKDPELQQAKLAEFDDIREGAVFTLAYQLIEKGDRQGAAEAYVQFMKEYPNSKFYKDALFNAANNFELTGKADRAISLYEQYVAKYPSDDRSPALYFRIADTYSATMDLPKSVAAYDSVVKLFPAAADAPGALYNASFFRVGMGDHAGAARGYEKYATTYPNQPDAEDVYYRAGAQWELVGDREAEEFYTRYLKRYPNQNPNHSIEAAYKLARIYEKRNDTRRAATSWQQVQASFNANASSPTLTAQTRGVAAAAALRDLLRDFEVFKQVKWTTSEAKNVDLLTKTKAAERKSLEERSLNLITTYQDYDTTAASVYLQGMSFFAYADMAYNIPPPKGLSEEELGIYEQTIAERFVIPNEDFAKVRLKQGLDKARAEKRWTEWNTKMVIALNEHYPSEYPSERQESRGALVPPPPQLAGPEPVPQTRSSP